MTPAAAPPPLLEFEGVELRGDAVSGASLCEVSFALRAGELLLVLLDREHLSLPLGDAASGLLVPERGVVRFEGQDWRTRSVDAAAACRGRMGRLFDGAAWVVNLSLEDNLTLGQCHHTRRALSELCDEAAELARQFKLPGMPCGSCERYAERDLRKAACIRAFMGAPAVISLERPTHDIYADVMPGLANAVFSARRRGAAVLWTTDDIRVWADPGLLPTRRLRAAGARLHDREHHEDALPIPAR